MAEGCRPVVATHAPEEREVALGLALMWVGLVASSLNLGGIEGRLDFTPIIIRTLLIALVGRLARHVICARQTVRQAMAELEALSAQDFEQWVAARFRDLAYSVRATEANRGRGADLIARSLGEVAVIQCLRNGSAPVGEAALQQLYGVMQGWGATRAYLVTTGRLTRPARRWTAGKPIAVWDGDHLARLWRQLTAWPQRTANEGSIVTVAPAKRQRASAAVLDARNLLPY